MKVAEYFATHKCVICNSQFETDNPRASYCQQCHWPDCPICGKQFYRKHSKMKTCSKSCGSKLAGKKRVRTQLLCHHCNNSFYPSNGHLGMKYCSQDCRYKSKRKKDSDKNRNSWRYRSWRKMVIKRDDYTCQKCGSTKHLQAHHIQEWKYYPELRYEVDNGQTLCKFCHSDHHGKPITRTNTHRLACEDCGIPIGGRGKSNYCRSCSLKHSPKAIKQRQSRTRNQNGQFTNHD